MARVTSRALDLLGALWSTATAAPVSGAETAYRTLFTTVRRLVLRRPLRVPLESGELRLTVTDLDSQLDVRALSVGQLSDVRVVARDIHWPQGRFERATVRAHNVHVRPTVPPVLVAAPVDLTVEVPADTLDALFRWAAPRLSGHVGDDGVARLRWAGRPEAGHLEVHARLDGTTLWLQPHTIGRRGRRWTLPARTPAYPVRLPDLGHGLRITDIEFAPGSVLVSGTLPQWRMDLSRTRLEDIVDQLTPGTSAATRGIGDLGALPINLAWLGLGL